MEIVDRIRTKINNFYKRVSAVVRKFSQAYLFVVILMALAGYALIFLFPVLVIISIERLFDVLPNTDLNNWQPAVIWLVTLLISALFSYRIIKIKPQQPEGLTLNAEKTPEIFKLVEQYRSHFKRPKIDRIVITKEYELDIIKVPKWGLPVWSTNTMVIGLPVLLCFPQKQFECMLARRIGQFSKRHNPILNWLYQLRPIWQQYSIAYGKQQYIDRFFLKWLISVYASMYSAISTYAARLDELNADTYAMEIFIHDDVREMITADSVYSHYMKQRYWPAIEKVASVKADASLTPYKNISASMLASMKDSKLRSLINEVFKKEPDRKNPRAELKQRLENIGHDSPYMSEPANEFAATKCLGSSANAVISLIDKLWLNDYLKKIKKSRKNN
ncbi:MAG: hypothetical protein OEZ15_07480 [Gammaproteobacteria bacterium]|nr:hypothetical protein [Gammaproteobacteria bacterium]